MEKCPKCKGDIKFGVCPFCEYAEKPTPKKEPVKKLDK